MHNLKLLKSMYMLVLFVLLIVACGQDVVETETTSSEVETATIIEEATAVVSQSPTHQPTISSNSTAVPSISDITVTPSPMPTSDLIPGWQVYQNSFYEYHFSYPSEAKISSQGVTGFPTEELPADMTATEYRLQLKATYPEDICVTVEYQSSFVVFMAPWEKGGKYAAPCGVSGVGDYDIAPITETVMIDGYSYIATGQEVHEQDEEATWRGEFLSLQLGDGLSIQYGGGLGAYISHEEYLLTKELLLRIIASLRSPEEVQQTAVSTSVSTETPQPTVTAGTTLAPTATPLPYVIESEGQYENWHKYTNLTYGFSFSFPADWNVYTRDHSVWVRQGKQGLNIGVRWLREEVRIQRTGVGAGELIAEGTVDFLGQTLSRTVLVYEGKDKTVLYSSAVELEVDGRIFTLSVDYFDDPAIVLSEEVQQTADKILETFELVEPESLSNS